MFWLRAEPRPSSPEAINPKPSTSPQPTTLNPRPQTWAALEHIGIYNTSDCGHYISGTWEGTIGIDFERASKQKSRCHGAYVWSSGHPRVVSSSFTTRRCCRDLRNGDCGRKHDDFVGSGTNDLHL